MSLLFPLLFFLTEGKMLFVSHGLWQMGWSWPQGKGSLAFRKPLCFCPTAFCPLFLTSSLNCSHGRFPPGYVGLQVLIPHSPLENWLACCLVTLHWWTDHVSVTLTRLPGPSHVLLPDLSLGAWTQNGRWTPTPQTHHISAWLGLRLLSSGT